MQLNTATIELHQTQNIDPSDFIRHYFHEPFDIIRAIKMFQFARLKIKQIFITEIIFSLVRPK